MTAAYVLGNVIRCQICALIPYYNIVLVAMMFTWLYIILIPVVLLLLSCRSTINKLSPFIHILAALLMNCAQVSCSKFTSYISLNTTNKQQLR